MHDYFQILGVSDAAPADEIRRASRRLLGRGHPDFRDRSVAVSGDSAELPAARAVTEVAIDFVDMSAIVDRMQTAFFKTRD